MNRSNLEIEKKEEEKRESKRKFGSADWRGERHHPQEGKGRMRSEKGKGKRRRFWKMENGTLDKPRPTQISES